MFPGVSEKLASLASQFARTPNRGFDFHKRSQLFIRAHNETLSIVTVRVCNPDRSSARIQG
jgi:hypothetical protein